MKKIFYLVIVSVMFSFYGCIQTDTKVKLNPDGSGLIEETMLMKEEVAAMFREFVAAFDSTKAGEFNLFNEEELMGKAVNYGEGVSYESGEAIQVKGYEGYKIIYSFDDINKIKLNPSPDDKIPMGDEEEGSAEKKDLVFFNFTKGNPSVLTIKLPEEEKVEKSETEEMEINDSTANVMKEKIIEMFDGMRMKVVLDVNGDIDETNATFIDGNEITLFDVDFSEIINNKEVLEEMTKSQDMSMEQFGEITSKIPGIKFEMKKEVTVKFR